MYPGQQLTSTTVGEIKVTNTAAIYLAGPIADCTKGEANDWRTMVQERLPHNIVGISPLRCEPLIGDKYGMIYDDPRFGTASAITAKNRFDTLRCDMILAYLPRNGKPSVGTTLELGWAMAIEKPIILVTDDPAYFTHPLIMRKVDWIFDNFDDAFDVINGILGDYLNGTQTAKETKTAKSCCKRTGT